MADWQKLKRIALSIANWAVLAFLVLLFWGIVRLHLGY
jgi:hypothetical protein